MELLSASIIVALLLVAFLGLDLVALRFGVDSRDPIGDDHRR
jgi:hypothetical protein